MDEIDLRKAQEELRRYERPPEELLEADGSDLEADAVLDVRGEVCPHPVDLALQRLAGLRSGQVLKEITDHTMATHNVPEAVKEKGLGEVLAIDEPEPGLYEIYICRH